jgi:hypothetical protein
MEMTISSINENLGTNSVKCEMALYIADRFVSQKYRFNSDFAHTPSAAILFFYYLSDVLATDKYEHYTNELLVDTFRMLLRTKKGVNESILSGNAWIFSHLVDNDMININLDNNLEEIDLLICNNVQTKFSDHLVDGGLLSKAGYLTDRLRNTACNINRHKIAESLAYVVEEIDYRLTLKDKDNITVAHLEELQRIFFYMNKLYPEKIYLIKQESIFSNVVPKILTCFNSLIRGDISYFKLLEDMALTLGIYNSLLRFAGNKMLYEDVPDLSGYIKNINLDIIKPETIKNPYAAIKCMKLLLNIKPLYKDLYEYNTLLNLLYDSLSLFSLSRQPGHFSSNMGFPNIGFSGAAGIGLVLLEFESDKKIDWEDVFMLYS